MKPKYYTSTIFLFLLLPVLVFAQLSPGKLAAVHAHLEGLSNCTKCHELGSKVSNDLCLNCHKELKSRIAAGKGYHVSSEVKGKLCSACHSDHHGLQFKMIRFEPEKFNHQLTGYSLTGAHRNKKCNDCHKPAFIADKEIRQKKYTWMGLSTQCAACHDDYHQKSLGNECAVCHITDAFKPASLFNHDRSAYKLQGKHRDVECVKCHAIILKEGKKYQQFKGIQYQSCKNCHKDPHENKFGNDCASCHTYESFRNIKTLDRFDHSKTRYILENKHLTVSCKSCHKSSYTAPLKHDRCTDCHLDYHENQFANGGIKPDCAECHSTKGFQGSSYTLEKHNTSPFPLEGAHAAIPCLECHKKSEKWNFRNIGTQCRDCHKDIHDPFIDKKYYPNSDCKTCHNNDSWHVRKFDHARTGFVLTGAHTLQSCRICHFRENQTGKVDQRFSSLTGQFMECHADKHFGQFETKGVTDCAGCHGTQNWKINNFDHTRAAFKLDGKHVSVPCSKCHEVVTAGQNSYVLYKTKKLLCKDCH